MTDFSFPNRLYSITNLLTGTLAENFPPVSYMATGKSMVVEVMSSGTPS